jgi:hypothetical protein
MTHDPLCGLSQPCDDEVAEHGFCSMQHGEFCIHCYQWCICDVIGKVRDNAIAAAVQRVEALLAPLPNTWPSMIRRSDAIDAIRGCP